MIERNTISCIDCIEGMTHIPDGYVDAIITDLPYGHTQNAWDVPIEYLQLWRQFTRITKPSSSIVLFGQGMFTADLMQSNRKLWKYNLVWEKSTVTGFLNANRQPLRSHEDILVFYDKQPTYNPQKVPGPKIHSRGSIGKNRNGTTYNSCANTLEPEENVGMKFPRSVLHFDTVPPSLKIHPTEKPVLLLEYLVKTYTNSGDIILDCCCGVGSTLVACKMNGRDYIGFDTLDEYVTVARSRLHQTKDPRSIP